MARATEIEFVRRTGKRVKTGLLDVRVAASPASLAAATDAAERPEASGGRARQIHAGQSMKAPRVGVIVPKYRHTIVERNRLRRRLRELVRTRMLPVIVARDVVIRALPQAYATSFDALRREVDSVIARIS